MTQFFVEKLTPKHAGHYRQLMLSAYAAHPSAFTSSVSDRADLPLDWWEQRIGNHCDSSTTVYGMFNGDDLIAVVGLGRDPRQRVAHKAKIFGMYTAPEHRRQRCGSVLLDTLIADADDQLSQLHLTVTKNNDDAIHLYQAAGFVIYGEEPNAIVVDGIGYTKLLMMKVL